MKPLPIVKKLGRSYKTIIDLFYQSLLIQKIAYIRDEVYQKYKIQQKYQKKTTLI